MEMTLPNIPISFLLVPRGASQPGQTDMQHLALQDRITLPTTLGYVTNSVNITRSMDKILIPIPQAQLTSNMV